MKVPLNAAGQDAARLCPVKVFRFLAELPHGGAGGLVPIERRAPKASVMDAFL
jgi:hypothetical protein